MCLCLLIVHYLQNDFTWLILLLLLREKYSISFAGSFMCSNLFFRFVNIGFFKATQPSGQMVSSLQKPLAEHSSAVSPVRLRVIDSREQVTWARPSSPNIVNSVCGDAVLGCRQWYCAHYSEFPRIIDVNCLVWGQRDFCLLRVPQRSPKRWNDGPTHAFQRHSRQQQALPLGCPLSNHLRIRYTVRQTTHRRELISLFILGYDQQHLEDLLSYFLCARHRVAHVFVDGLLTASHTRKVTWLEAPIGPLLFCQDIETVNKERVNYFAKTHLFWWSSATKNRPKNPGYAFSDAY